MRLKKLLVFTVLVGIAAVTLVACSSKGSNASKKETVVIATDSDTAPFTFRDKNNNPTGFDIEVMKAVFKDSDKYEVSFETTKFDSILSGIDTGRYQIAANDFNYNEERAKKYLFSDAVSLSNYAIVTKSGTKYDSFEDLSGKSTEALSGSNYAQALEKWNEDHPRKDPITVNYVDGSTGLTSRLQDLSSGKIDFIFYDQISSTYASESQNFNFQVTPLKDKIGSDKDGKEYFLFAKTEKGEEIQSFVNKRLKELRKDGTLKKLSEKYFKGDYVSSLK